MTTVKRLPPSLQRRPHVPVMIIATSDNMINKILKKLGAKRTGAGCQNKNATPEDRKHAKNALTKDSM